jgi:hypothetical protein
MKAIQVRLDQFVSLIFALLIAVCDLPLVNHVQPVMCWRMKALRNAADAQYHLRGCSIAELVQDARSAQARTSQSDATSRNKKLH